MIFKVNNIIINKSNLITIVNIIILNFIVLTISQSANKLNKKGV